MQRGRKRVENPATARRILAAAVKMFSERGLAGARMDEIAGAARVNKALLYYYFGSKARLHRLVLECLFAQLQSAVVHSGPIDGSPRKELIAHVNGYFDFVAAHPSYPRLLHREATESGANLAWLVQRYFRPLHERLGRVIRRGVKSGEFRAVDPRNTAVTLTAMTLFYFAAAPVLSEMWGRNALASRAVAARRRAILDLVEHGVFRQKTRTR